MAGTSRLGGGGGRIGRPTPTSKSTWVGSESESSRLAGTDRGPQSWRAVSASPDRQMLLVKDSNGNSRSTVSGDGPITIIAGEPALFIYMGAGLGWPRFVR